MYEITTNLSLYKKDKKFIFPTKVVKLLCAYKKQFCCASIQRRNRKKIISRQINILEQINILI